MPTAAIDRLLAAGLVPAPLIRLGIRRLLSQRLRSERSPTVDDQQQRLMRLVQTLRTSPIAVNTQEANLQHYEVPTAFFQRVLGQHLKYSCGYWPSQPPLREAAHLLNQAEAAMLHLTCERAGVRNGERLLDLGCGWGSLSLWLAERYPDSEVTGLSNSTTQRAYIEQTAAARGLKNLRVVTADINTFESTWEFDRILSVEMFEHMRNYERLLAKLAGWLKPGGHLFVHIFTHRELAYPFEVRDESDWMARWFFTGGLMPSADLLLYFTRHFQIERQWRVSGTHYQRTARAWRERMESQRAELMPLFSQAYGPDQATRFWHYWRIFFLACEELFGWDGGREWFVSHYLFSRR